MSFDPTYLHEKLCAARRSLMLPHPRGEEESLVSAMHECSLGLGSSARPEDFDEHADGWVRTIQQTIDTTGLVALGDEGTFMVKARSMSDDDRMTFANAVDELAFWTGDRS